MTLATFVGAEISAAGWRLAGVRVCTCAAGEGASALAAACANSQLVLLSSRLAAEIGARRLRAALSATSPLVLVVPDLEGDAQVPDLAARLHAQLGLEA